MKVLLTGGAGYIGSHTAVVLKEAGHQVHIFDNFSNSEPSVINRLEMILGDSIPFIHGDTRDTPLLSKTLIREEIDAVIHFAGLKAVGDSTQNPLAYYANNVQGTISLLEAMKSSNIKDLIFSSSATVYGNPQYLPVDETHPTGVTNPYGRTKLHIEEMLHDLADSDSDWKVLCLRYFNPVGAHSSGLIGENPRGLPNNLMPYIAQVAAGKLPQLNVYGNDYQTPDGTGIRDYIHVVDLAQGHVSALNYLKKVNGWDCINLGTGQGYSVIQMISAFELACGKKIPFQYVAKRPGDITASYASVEKAATLMGWRAKRSLEDMCSSSWKWVKTQIA